MKQYIAFTAITFFVFFATKPLYAQQLSPTLSVVTPIVDVSVNPTQPAATPPPVGGPTAAPTPIPTAPVQPTAVPQPIFINPTSVPAQYYPPVGTNQTPVEIISPTPEPPEVKKQSSPTPLPVLRTDPTSTPQNKTVSSLSFSVPDPLSEHYANAKLDQPTRDTLLFSAVLFITYGLYLLRHDMKELSNKFNSRSVERNVYAKGRLL